MSKIKAFLERYPRTYKIVRRIHIPLAVRYSCFKQYLGRNRFSDLWAGKSIAEECWNSRDHPHRSFVVERIATFSPISNILEIGSGSGPNLYLLAKRFPYAEIRGIEINPHAVEVGNEKFSREGPLNVRLSVGRAEELGKFPDKSFDVVFTDAVLIYVSRGIITSVIKDIVRIARKGLILVERHDFAQRLHDTGALGVCKGGLWVRDYVALLKQFIPPEKIHVTRITEDIWPDSGWIKNGALIEATIP